MQEPASLYCRCYRRYEVFLTGCAASLEGKDTILWTSNCKRIRLQGLPSELKRSSSVASIRSPAVSSSSCKSDIRALSKIPYIARIHFAARQTSHGSDDGEQTIHRKKGRQKPLDSIGARPPVDDQGPTDTAASRPRCAPNAYASGDMSRKRCRPANQTLSDIPRQCHGDAAMQSKQWPCALSRFWSAAKVACGLHTAFSIVLHYV